MIAFGLLSLLLCFGASRRIADPLPKVLRNTEEMATKLGGSGLNINLTHKAYTKAEAMSSQKVGYFRDMPHKWHALPPC